MKLTIQKSFNFVVDTASERARIKKAFKTDKATRDKLVKLMDMVEMGYWEEAKAELEGKWWNGYDKKLECSRLEFIGLLNCSNSEIDPWVTYRELVYAMAGQSDIFRIIKRD